MNIEGTYTLQASPENVWQALMDQQILLRTIPGIEKLEPVGEDTYEIVMHIQHTPLRGSYRGHITLSEQQYPYHYRIAVQGEGRQNSINGSGSIHLNGHDNTTVIAYKGTLTSGLPSMAVKGAAKLLIQQFFTTLASQLRLQSNGQVVASEETEDLTIVRRPAGNIVILPPLSATETVEKTTVTRALVRLLGLGAGDPVQEAEWETRIRRSSVIAALLILIWIGMRLPRRT
ncbi:MAG TPA: carbon monoxide dehydrogenase subunit G [Ktedonosporobacter sp.]|nr:carbon monoxide dehydrogenase subunit G [Ktedonosporobacter sp.]